MLLSPVPLAILITYYLLFVLCSSYTSFLFGDSLADAGNNNYLFTLSRADSPPYGIDFAASGGRPTGRFTNGRTISDIIGEELGETKPPPPYLAPTTSGDTIFRGVNYASGASGVLDETGSLFIGRVPLSRQISYFEQTRASMVQLRGENATSDMLKDAVFSIITGSNDFLNYLQPSIPFLGEAKLSSAMLQELMISNLTAHLKRLHKLGARKFVVVGVGPLGCIPYVRALQLSPGRMCSSPANRLIQSYNVKLKRLLGRLNKELGPRTLFVYANAYNIFQGIIRNYKRYGFKNANLPCCGGSFPPFICFKGTSKNSSSALCEDRSKYVFWDAYHPTEAVNIIIAKKLLDGDGGDAYPVNLRNLNEYKL